MQTLEIHQNTVFSFSFLKHLDERRMIYHSPMGQGWNLRFSGFILDEGLEIGWKIFKDMFFFLKWVVSPTTMGFFLLKMIILGCEMGTTIFGNTYMLRAKHLQTWFTCFHFRRSWCAGLAKWWSSAWSSWSTWMWLDFAKRTHPRGSWQVCSCWPKDACKFARSTSQWPNDTDLVSEFWWCNCSTNLVRNWCKLWVFRFF